MKVYQENHEKAKIKKTPAFCRCYLNQKIRHLYTYQYVTSDFLSESPTTQTNHYCKNTLIMFNQHYLSYKNLTRKLFPLNIFIKTLTLFKRKRECRKTVESERFTKLQFSHE